MKKANLPSNASRIEFVYFDVGGVALIDFSGNDGRDLLRRHWGITDKNQALFDAIMHSFKKQMCVDDAVVVALSKALLEIPGFGRESGFDWVQDFVDRFETNESIWPIFTKLRENNVGVGLLTDMYPTMMDKIVARKLLPDFEFYPVIDSSVEKCEKNSLKIFTIAQERIDVKPDNVLFVDNSPEKIVWGKKIGWQTFLYNPREPQSSSTQLSSVLFG